MKNIKNNKFEKCFELRGIKNLANLTSGIAVTNIFFVIFNLLEEPSPWLQHLEAFVWWSWGRHFACSSAPGVDPTLVATPSCAVRAHTYFLSFLLTNAQYEWNLIKMRSNYKLLQLFKLTYDINYKAYIKANPNASKNLDLIRMY